MKEFLLFAALASPPAFMLLRALLGDAAANRFGRPTLLGLILAGIIFILISNSVKVSKWNPFSADDWESLGDTLNQEVGQPVVNAGLDVYSGLQKVGNWVDQFGNSCNEWTAFSEKQVMDTANGPGPD